MTTIKVPDCFDCKFAIDLYSDKAICKAFTKGIPYSIMFENADHKKPLPGQKNDIVFEAKK